MSDRPKTLLIQNSELRKAGVYNWTLPAYFITLPSGERFNCCPNAGYSDQEANDLLAVTMSTTKIGIVANNIATANKRFNGKTMRRMLVRTEGEPE
jgi:hypothetical protein